MSLLDRVLAVFGGDTSAPALQPLADRRADAWVNGFTGFGTARDKVAGSYFDWTVILSSAELEALFYNDDVAAKIVGKLPFEMFRRGYELEGHQAERCADSIEELGLDRKIRQAITWARLYGGAAVVLGIMDGQEMDKPVNVESVQKIAFANVIDRRYLVPLRYYSDPTQSKFGEPEIYTLVVPVGMNQNNFLIHESRLLRFDGTEVDVVNRQRNAGWSYSVLQRVYDTIQKFGNAFSAASQLTVDAGQAVFSMKGWITAVGANAGANAARMTMVDQQRSSGRAIVLDTDKESFRREGVQLSGLPDLLDRFMVRVAGAAEMPVSILFGQAPAGMNATGESDLTQWYDSVAAAQLDTVLPALTRVCNLLTKGQWDGEIEFKSLREPDDKKRADVDYVNAQTWAIYIANNVLSAEEVKLEEFGDIPIEVDVEALQAIIEAENDAAEMMNYAAPQLPIVASAPTSEGPNPAPAETLGTAGAAQPNAASGGQTPTSRNR